MCVYVLADFLDGRTAKQYLMRVEYVRTNYVSLATNRVVCGKAGKRQATAVTNVLKKAEVHVHLSREAKVGNPNPCHRVNSLRSRHSCFCCLASRIGLATLPIQHFPLPPKR